MKIEKLFGTMCELIKKHPLVENFNLTTLSETPVFSDGYPNMFNSKFSLGGVKVYMGYKMNSSTNRSYLCYAMCHPALGRVYTPLEPFEHIASCEDDLLFDTGSGEYVTLYDTLAIAAREYTRGLEEENVLEKGILGSTDNYADEDYKKALEDCHRVINRIKTFAEFGD